MNKTILKLVTSYEKARKELRDLDCSQIDIRFTWAQNNVFDRAERVADAVSRYLKKERKKEEKQAAEKKAFQEKQCDYVERHGTSGYLCCRFDRGHEGNHKNGYDTIQSPQDEWMPKAVWEEKYGALAEACYR